MLGPIYSLTKSHNPSTRVEKSPFKQLIKEILPALPTIWANNIAIVCLPDLELSY